jgi:putative peptidoglycan lipid II flippase
MHWPIAGAILLVGALTFVAKIAVLAKEALIAGRFGAGDAVDAFFIAFLLPSFAVSVIASSIHSSFLPAYVEVRDREGRAEADRLASSVVAGAVVLLFAVTALLALVGVPAIRLLGATFPPHKLELTIRLFYVLLPTLFITGITAIWSAALNAGERFAVVAAAPVITPLVIAGTLLFAGPAWGIYAVAAGTLAGLCAEAVVIGASLARRQPQLWPRWYGMSPAIRRMTAQLSPVLAGALMMSSSTFIDQSMAARLGTGSVSALNFGGRLVTGVLGIASVALGTAVFPYFAQRIATRDRAGALSLLRTYSALVVAASVPVVLVLVLYSGSIIELLFERGSFTAGDTQIVSEVQRWYALQIPFFLLGLLGVRFISSLRGNQVLLWIGAANVATNIVGNLIFMRLFGVAGIAMSTTLVYALSCVLIALAIRLLLTKEPAA